MFKKTASSPEENEPLESTQIYYNPILLAGGFCCKDTYCPICGAHLSNPSQVGQARAITSLYSAPMSLPKYGAVYLLCKGCEGRQDHLVKMPDHMFSTPDQIAGMIVDKEAKTSGFYGPRWFEVCGYFYTYPDRTTYLLRDQNDCWLVRKNSNGRYMALEVGTEWFHGFDMHHLSEKECCEVWNKAFQYSRLSRDLISALEMEDSTWPSWPE